MVIQAALSPFLVGALERIHLKRSAKAFLDRMVRWRVPRVAPQLVRTLPHDVRAFTQGLACSGGRLYESAGGAPQSTLRCIDPQDGRVERLIPVEGDFAEGIAILGKRLFQISYVSGKARVYSFPELEKIGELRYTGEGWGLAAGPDGLVMSDGSSLLRFRDESFAVTRTLRASSHGFPVRLLNDLECVGRSIYANILCTSDVVHLSADTGRLQRIIDCSALFAAAAPEGEHAVMNGIAYNADDDTFFLTGKNWGLMFEVKIPSP